MRKYICAKILSAVIGTASLFYNTNDKATIRVLLMTNGYGGYFHEDVEYEVLGKREGIEILSIERDCGNPVYQGRLDIIKTEKGNLLVNELPIEEYLKAVVPSEMPSDYELEALKAQAICARTYAYRQLQNGTLETYFADVDDSVSYQVYNNQKRSELTDRAVEETRGMIMTYEGEPIDAYFFSTSSGMTSTDEVWNEEESPCLKSIVTDFDKEMPWFRWKVYISLEIIEDNLYKNGYNVGVLKEIKINQRSQGGAAISCVFIGTDDTVEITNEYNIRNILSTDGLDITRQDGSAVTNFSILPSAYIELTPKYENDLLIGYEINGGGYGHGVGMSQNGANEMAKQGYSCFEILDYYYQDFEMKKMN